MSLESESLQVDFSAISRLLSRNAISQRMQPFLQQAATAVKGEIDSRIPIGATGNASRSTAIRFDEAPDTIGATVYALLPYMWFIEHPRAAGKQPPVAALMDWVRRKLTTSLRQSRVASGSIKSKRSSVNVGDAEVKSVAFLIARSIGRKGTYANPAFPPPKPFEKGFEAAQRDAFAIIERGESQLIAQLNE